MAEGRIITSLAGLAMLDGGIKMVFPIGRSRNLEHCMSIRMGQKRGGEERFGILETFKKVVRRSSVVAGNRPLRLCGFYRFSMLVIPQHFAAVTVTANPRVKWSSLSTLFTFVEDSYFAILYSTKSTMTLS